MKKNREFYLKRLAVFASLVLGLIAIFAIFIAPETAGAIGLSIAAIPIWGYVKDKTFKELTVDQIEKLEMDEKVEYFNELNLHKAAQLKEWKAQLKKENTETLTASIAKLKEEIVKDNIEQLKLMKEAMEAQGIALRKLTNGATPTKEDFATYLETNKTILFSIIKDGSEKTIVIKADTVRASISDAKEYYRVPEIGQLATRKLTLYDLFAKIPVGEASGGIVAYYDWDEATTVRAAAVIAENGVFPASTAKWKWYSLPLVKVGDTLPVSEEFDKDLPRFSAELSQFLQINVDLIVDEELYDGDGTGNHMTGVYTAATTYTAAASAIADANIYDLIVDVKRNMTSGKRSKYMPNFVLMNAADIIKYKLKKDANNNYVMPPFVSENGQVIDNILVIETSVVTANTLLVGDNRYAKIYEVDGYTLVKGLADGDFMSDMFTLKARRRLMLLVKNADKGGFNKVTSISAALVTLAS